MRRRLRLALVLAGFSLVVAGCGGGVKQSAGPSSLEGQAGRKYGALTDLRDIAQLRTLFGKASRQPRVIILVSPT